MTETPRLAELRKAGKKLARLDAQRVAAMAELREAIRAADEEGGHTRTELVAAAGVAKQTVYDALKTKPVALGHVSTATTAEVYAHDGATK